MIFTDFPIIDRIFTGFCILCAWFMTGLIVYAAFNGLGSDRWYWATIGWVCAVSMPVLSFVMTFPCGLLRYTLTGDDRPKYN
jgi:hypothetical protein